MCYCDFVLYSLWKIYSRTGNMNKTSLSWLIGVTIIAKFVSLLGKKLSGMPMFNELFEWVTLSFGVSALTNFLIIVWFARIKTQSLKRNDTSAVQASHLNPTVRLGGLALVLALLTNLAHDVLLISHHAGIIRCFEALEMEQVLKHTLSRFHLGLF